MVFFTLDHPLRVSRVLRRLLLHHQRVRRHVLVVFQDLQPAQDLLDFPLILLLDWQLVVLLMNFIFFVLHRIVCWVSKSLVGIGSGSDPAGYLESVSGCISWISPGSLVVYWSVDLILAIFCIAAVLAVDVGAALFAVVIFGMSPLDFVVASGS